MGHIVTDNTTYTGNPAAFTGVAGSDIRSLTASISPVQDLHGYDSPWPGGGGKNLANFVNGYNITAEGVIGTNAKRAATIDPIPIESGVSYIYTSETELSCIYAVFNGDTLVRRLSGIASGTTLDTSDGTDLYVCIYGSSDYTATIETDKPMVRKSTEPAGYEPYSNICPITGWTGANIYVSPTQDQADATTYNVDWTDEAGTVYGGTLDVTSGKLTVTWAKYTNFSSGWSRHATSGYFGKTIDKKPGQKNVISDIQKTVNTNKISNTIDAVCGRDTDGRVFIHPSETVTTSADFESYMAGHYIVYELSTPVEYTLTPQTVAALLGQNYVWADTGNSVSVVVNAPLNGFLGWIVRTIKNGVTTEIPLRFIRAETYTVTPDQRMEWNAERDVSGVLHRETVENTPPKIEFNTPYLTSADINVLNGIIKSALTNTLQRNITIQYYDPELDEYWEWDCYMPDVKYKIRNVDVANHVVNYEELRYAFIGY